MTSDAETLAQLQHGSVVAAAGCGKTELIARAVAVSQTRQLVLTHTNAGVEVLLRRLRQRRADPNLFAVDTIAGWSLRYVSSFPGHSGGLPSRADAGVFYPALYAAMTRLLSNSVIRKVVSASYGGVLVDEYQDCDQLQHSLMLALAQIVPTRVLGDPLQGVFRFSGDPPDWKSQVETAFPPRLSLETPWRWRRPGENAALGQWLSKLREAFREGRSVDLADGPLTFLKSPSLTDWHAQVQSAGFATRQNEGRSALVFKWGSDSHLAARLTGGYFQVVEPIEAKGAVEFLTKLERADAKDRPGVLLAFAREVANGIWNPKTGGTRVPPPYVRRLLDDVALGGPPSSVAESLEALTGRPPARVFRRELLWAATGALRDVEEFGGLAEALRQRRNLASRRGRRLATRSAGTTLLLKGMEFEHAVVVLTARYSVHDLYVALTRGSRSLTVVAPSSKLELAGR